MLVICVIGIYLKIKMEQNSHSVKIEEEIEPVTQFLLSSTASEDGNQLAK